jgi:large repetitive protein
MSLVETVKIMLDGVETPIDAFLNQAPVADETASITTDEDTTVSGQVVAYDIEGDTLPFRIASGPSNGTVWLDAATGAYIYMPAANFSGSDAFDVAVTDAWGAVSIQRISVTVSAIADTPSLAVAFRPA